MSRQQQEEDMTIMSEESKSSKSSSNSKKTSKRNDHRSSSSSSSSRGSSQQKMKQQQQHQEDKAQQRSRRRESKKSKDSSIESQEKKKKKQRKSSTRGGLTRSNSSCNGLTTATKRNSTRGLRRSNSSNELRRSNSSNKLRRSNSFNALLTKCKNVKKEVKFAKNDQVYEIPHIDDLSDREIDDVWFSPDEMTLIRRTAITMLSKMSSEDAQSRLNGLMIRSNSSNNLLKRSEQQQQGQSSHSRNGNGLNDLDDSYRGLETNTKEHMKKRSMETSIMQHTVFRLQPFKSKAKKKGQQQQRSQDEQDQDVDIDQMISDLLSKYSSPSVMTAIRRAKRDEKTAMKIYSEKTEIESSSSSSERSSSSSSGGQRHSSSSNKTSSKGGRRVKNKLPGTVQRSTPTVQQYGVRS